jgi:hypothetical protein
MSILRNKTIFISCWVVLILLGTGVLPVGASNGQGLLPEGLVVEKTFSPGRGRSVGRVQRVQGEAVIMHADILKGYEAANGMRLYNKDTIITLENAKIRFRLNDGSILSLSSETKLTLNKSVYEKEKKQRSSFLGMAFGKARILVVKLLDFKRSEFKIKTPTAVCGVRGSDFILEATATETTATALEKTEIELLSLAFLDEKPLILKEYETSRVKRGQRPTPLVKLPYDEIERKRKLFLDVTPEEGTDMQDDDGLGSKAGDDAGVDDVAELGGEELNLEGMEIPPPDIEKPLPVPDPPKVKDTVLEGNLAGELPNFPITPK